MLFLAVTAGFYAENIRERSVERHKEHEYMQSMLQDLEQDSIQMGMVSKELNVVKAGLDSLAAISYTEHPDDSTVYSMYFLNNPCLRLIPITFSDRTSSQLKNSGSMRLVRNKQVSDSILGYWQQIDYFNYVSPLNENFRRKGREISFKIFDYGTYKVDSAFVKNRSMIKNRKLQLLTEDMSLRHEYINYLYAYRATLFIYYQPPIAKLQRQGQNLMALIRKNYGD
jgi:aryl carrier-like protein